VVSFGSAGEHRTKVPAPLDDASNHGRRKQQRRGQTGDERKNRYHGADLNPVSARNG
jgi:hypothetical protein